MGISHEAERKIDLYCKVSYNLGYCFGGLGILFATMGCDRRIHFNLDLRCCEHC
jgi:hypothetical protein